MVNNPKGLVSNKEGGEEEEGTEIEEGRNIFREAMRRGSKRLTYRTPETEDTTVEEPEETLCPRIKRRRVLGQLGQGWEKFTLDRSPDP